MSHRDSCPSEWEARRRGYSAGEEGDYGRNPYRDECEEAASAWDRGYRSGQYEREEREEEQARVIRARHRRQEEESFELANYDCDYYTEAEQHYFAEMAQEEADFYAQMETDIHIGQIVTAIECSEGAEAGGSQ